MRITAVLDSLSLAATLRVAVTCSTSARARKAGVDPSCQESRAVATDRLLELRESLADATRLLRMYRLLDDEAGVEGAEVIRQFEVLMLLREVADSLCVVHQSLLSLYPAVDAHFVENTRLLGQRWRENAEAGAATLGDAAALDEYGESLGLELARIARLAR